ncbi:MAG: hypothetical protein ABL927_09945 [Bdellovibrionales bacterium]
MAQRVIKECKERVTEPTQIIFDLTNSTKKITALEPLKGKEGYMIVQQVQVVALEEEDYIVTQALELSGASVDSDLASKMLTLPGTVDLVNNFKMPEELETSLKEKVKQISKEVDRRNASFFDEELLKLDRWAEDKRNSLKAALKEYDDEIKDLKKQARDAGSLPLKLEFQKKIRSIEVKRDSAWREYDSAAKEIDKQKETLIDNLENRLGQTMKSNNIIKIKWKVV